MLFRIPDAFVTFDVFGKRWPWKFSSESVILVQVPRRTICLGRTCRFKDVFPAPLRFVAPNITVRTLNELEKCTPIPPTQARIPETPFSRSCCVLSQTASWRKMDCSPFWARLSTTITLGIFAPARRKAFSDTTALLSFFWSSSSFLKSTSPDPGPFSNRISMIPFMVWKSYSEGTEIFTPRASSRRRCS